MKQRLLGTLLTLTAHGLLVLLVWHLYPFLGEHREPGSSVFGAAWWAVDALLVLQFCVLHSLLLTPPMRQRLARWLPQPLHGGLYTLVTCLSLLLLLFAWQTSPVVFYRLDGMGAWLMRVAYFLAWVGMVYSLSLTGFGTQTGWTSFWAWLRSGPPDSRPFVVTGAYRVVRHPVYLCFLAQVWLTTLLTLDRALLCVLLTAYIFLGSYWKDRRMVFYLGDVYRRYQARVPGYPIVGVGPLGRVPHPADVPVAGEDVTLSSQGNLL